MPQITDIRPQKRKLRFNIYLDGKFSFGLDAETLVKSGLKIDQHLSPEEIEKLIKENEFSKFYNLILRFLSVRPRSEKELKDWFTRKEVGEEVRKMVWKKLQNLGYINDEEFAKWWIEQRQTFRPTGFRRLALELRQKGISNDIVESIKYKVARKDELVLAKTAVEKKLRLWENLPPEKFRQKLTSFLARRGFSWETISEIINKFHKTEED